MAEAFEQVIAIEPIPDNFRKIPDLPNVKKINAAVGDEIGTFLMSPGDSNTGEWHFSAGPCGKVSASVIILDDLDLKPDFIKLDIEGYEIFALRGAEKTIEEHGPFIMVELSGHGERYGHPDSDVVNWLEERGYRHVEKFAKDHLYSRPS